MIASLGMNRKTVHSSEVAVCAGRSNMARGYIARDPRTGKAINRRGPVADVDIRGLLPVDGMWLRIPVHEILPLARGDSDGLQISRSQGGGFARRVDALQALHRVMQSQINDAHEVLLDALDDDEDRNRIAALSALPAFALKRLSLIHI